MHQHLQKERMAFSCLSTVGTEMLQCMEKRRREAQKHPSVCSVNIRTGQNAWNVMPRLACQRGLCFCLSNARFNQGPHFPAPTYLLYPWCNFSTPPAPQFHILNGPAAPLPHKAKSLGDQGQNTEKTQGKLCQDSKSKCPHH